MGQVARDSDIKVGNHGISGSTEFILGSSTGFILGNYGIHFRQHGIYFSSTGSKIENRNPISTKFIENRIPKTQSEFFQMLPTSPERIPFPSHPFQNRATTRNSIIILIHLHPTVDKIDHFHLIFIKHQEFLSKTCPRPTAPSYLFRRFLIVFIENHMKIIKILS